MDTSASAHSIYPCQHRGWVSAHVDPRGAQARLKVDGKERSKWFAYAAYPSHAAAVQAARAWLELQRRKLQCPVTTGLRSKPSPRKRDQTLPVGITESAYTLRSGNTGTRFQVLWHDGTRPRMKSFTVGVDNVATEAAWRTARRKACAFRRAYEKARKAGERFQPEQELYS